MRGVLTTLLFLFLGFFIGGFVFYLTMEVWHGWLETVKVPDVVGMETEQASKTLYNAGLMPDITGEGKVIGTFPRPGMRVFKGRKVEVYTTSVNLNMLVKRIKGISFEFVKEALSFLKVKYGISKMRLPGEDGRVAGVYMRKDRLYLLVDVGDPPKFISIPDLRGMGFKEAEKVLKEKGIPFEKVGEGKVVVDQYPEPGSISTKMTLILR